MSLAASFLVAAAIVQLFAAASQARTRWLRRVWFLTSVVLFWQIVHDGLLLSMAPIYFVIVVAVALWLIDVRRKQRGRNSHSGRRPSWPRLTLIALIVPLSAVPLVEATTLPFEVDDYRDRTWVDAFDQLHATLESRYAFGAWKQVGWDELRDTFRPAVVEAEQKRNREAFYLAIRSYIHSIPDGHLTVRAPVHDSIKRKEIGGGFGLVAQVVDDGDVIAAVVEPNGPADQAGIMWGAQIVRWDGIPADLAVMATSTLWWSRPPATAEGVVIAQHQLLTRAPIGSERSITFRNPGRTEAQTASLTATDDRYSSLDAWPSTGDGHLASPAPVSYQMLEDDVGYIRIAKLEADGNGVGPVEAMNRAMEALGNARAMVLDTRGNRGGPDHYVPPMMSHFTSSRLLYEHIALRAPIGAGWFRVWSLHVEPNDRHFSGPIVVLVDHRTMSSGEGFALIAKQLPKANVMGFHGTAGSFGMAGGTVLLPTGIEVVYPWGQSLGADRAIQVDGDHLLDGGIRPDIVVPISANTTEAIHRRGQDVLLRAAVDYLQR